MAILVVGSFMIDLVTKTKRMPINGETVIGESFQTFLGGKGANQAVSAKRLGSEVCMVGMVGNDPYGDRFEAFFKAEEMDFSHVLRSSISTGIGSIQLDESGQNRIIIIPGANLQYTLEDLRLILPVLKTVNVVLCQLEMRMDVIEQVASMAKTYQKTLILNPAPMQPLSDELLSKVDYLTPNETELKSLSPQETCDSIDSMIAACNHLLQKGVKNVVVTLGEKGCLLVNRETQQLFPSYPVPVVDTVAAGDSFNGALAHCLDVSSPIETALFYANVVGALTVQKEGAIPSLPTREEVKQFIRQIQK